MSDEAIRLGVGTNVSYSYSEYEISVLMYFQIDPVGKINMSLGDGGGAKASEGGN